jgi:hypothetical protein
MASVQHWEREKKQRIMKDIRVVVNSFFGLRDDVQRLTETWAAEGYADKLAPGDFDRTKYAGLNVRQLRESIDAMNDFLSWFENRKSKMARMR